MVKLQLNKEFGKVTEVKGREGELSLNMPSKYFDEANKLIGANEEETRAMRSAFYKELEYADYVINGKINLLITFTKQADGTAYPKGVERDRAYATVESDETFAKVFENLNAKLELAFDYEETSGVKGKNVTRMYSRGEK